MDPNSADMDPTEPEVRKHTEVLRALVPLEGRDVLDIGCGAGALLTWIARFAGRCVGVDPSAEQIARARQASDGSPASFQVGSAESLSFPDGSFDVAIFFNALHHVPGPLMRPALGEALRILRPGGILYVAEPLAQGATFDLTQPIDDETLVRAEAQRAISDLDTGTQPVALDPVRRSCERYIHTVVYADFDVFRNTMVAVAPDRKTAFARHGDDLLARFHRLGTAEEGGRAFLQPMKVDVFARAVI